MVGLGFEDFNNVVRIAHQADRNEATARDLAKVALHMELARGWLRDGETHLASLAIDNARRMVLEIARRVGG